MEKDQLRDIDLRTEIEYALETWSRMHVKLAPFMMQNRVQFDLAEVQQEVDILKSTLVTLNQKLGEQKMITNDDDTFDWDSVKNMFPAMQANVDKHGEAQPPTESPEMQQAKIWQSKYEDEQGKFDRGKMEKLAKVADKRTQYDSLQSNIRDVKDLIPYVMG